METQKDFVTYEEAATILGIVPTSLYKLVSEGRLHSVRTPGTHRKKLSRQEVEAYGQGRSLQHSLQVTHPPLNPLDTNNVSPTMPIQDILKLVNEGFSAISSDHEKIAEQYKATVSPIINHVVPAPEQAFIAEVSQLMQALLNNMIVAIKTPNISEAPPATIIDMLVQGVNMPSQLKELLRDMATQLTQRLDSMGQEPVAA